MLSVFGRRIKGMIRLLPEQVWTYNVTLLCRLFIKMYSGCVLLVTSKVFSLGEKFQIWTSFLYVYADITVGPLKMGITSRQASRFLAYNKAGFLRTSLSARCWCFVFDLVYWRLFVMLFFVLSTVAWIAGRFIDWYGNIVRSLILDVVVTACWIIILPPYLLLHFLFCCR